MDELFVKAPLRTIAGLFLLVYSCKGQSQLIGPHQPIIARVGDDVMLPCHLDPEVDVVGRTLEWSRSDRNNVLVYMWRSGQEFEKAKHSSYRGRTFLFIEQLSHGNISLKLSNLKLSDRGTYRCFIIDDNKQTFIQLVVAPDSVALPVISLSGMDGDTGRVVLQCESSGWYPEPELLWLDGDGNLLSAGPTETVRGPDDLYTVSSRVTVEKKHNNKFTCRVQQKNINQTRDDLIHIPDDFFIIPYSSAVPIIVGLSVSLAVCIMLMLAFGFFLCRRNRTKTKRTFNKTEKDKEKKSSETEAEMLTSHEVVEMQDLEQKNMNNQHVLQELQQQQQLQDPKEEIRETMVHNETEINQEAAEEKEAAEEEKTQTEENNQLKENQAADSQSTWNLLPSWNFFRGSQAEQQKKEDEDEMTSLQKKLKDVQDEVNRWKEFNDIRKDLEDQLEEKNAEISKMKRELEKQIWEEKQNGKKYQKEINELNDLLTMNKELDGSKSEDVDHQKESRQQNSSSSDHHTDLTDIILEEIDKNCKSVRLKNTSMKEKLLGGCKLQLHINNKELLIYTFDQSFTVKAGGRISLWNPQCGSEYPPTVDLVWKDLKLWNPEDQLQFFLFSQTGEFKELKFFD